MRLIPKMHGGLRRGLGSDGALASLMGVLALGVYLRTLLPDVGGPEDTPKFQYLGAVLGTAHPPGYPLHTLLAHAFSYLPVGTLAYRANLLSAVAAAAAVVFAFLLARALGTSRPAACFAALTMAFGAAFWNYSVLAEVYTLSAALLLAVMFWLVRWRSTRRNRELYLASLAFALALGNHLVIAATAPAIILFLLLTDARSVLRPRTLLTAGAIVTSGFLQYAYILLRTRQGTPYREASATTIMGLIDVIRGGDYREYVFAFTWPQLLAERLPEFQRLVLAEFGVMGLVVAFVGLLVLIVRQWHTAVLLVLAFAGTTALVINMFGDLRGFLVIPLALAAPFLAFGGDLFHRVVSRFGRDGGLIGALILMLYPAAALRINFAANDWSGRTDEARFLRAWLNQLPARAAVLPEDYVTDSMLTYLQIESRAARRLLHPAPHAASVRDIFTAGERVYAFDARHAELSLRGFAFAPVEVPMRPPGRVLSQPRHAYQLTALLPTVPVGDAAWHDVTSVCHDGTMAVLIDNYRPFNATISMYAAADLPLRPHRLRNRYAGRGDPVMRVQQYDRHDPASLAQLIASVREEHDVLRRLGDEGRYVARIDAEVNDDGQFAAWGVALGAVPRRVLAFARPDRPHVSRALISQLPSRHLLGDRADEELTFGPSMDPLLGAGWHAPEREGDIEFRWTSGADAYVLLPLATVRNLSITVSVRGRPSSSITLSVNGRALPACALDGGWQSCTWRLPPDASRVGTNQLTLHSSIVARPSDEQPSTDARVLGVAVRSIRLEPAS